MIAPLLTGYNITLSPLQYGSSLIVCSPWQKENLATENLVAGTQDNIIHHWFKDILYFKNLSCISTYINQN